MLKWREGLVGGGKFIETLTNLTQALAKTSHQASRDRRPIWSTVDIPLLFSSLHTHIHP